MTEGKKATYSFAEVLEKIPALDHAGIDALRYIVLEERERYSYLEGRTMIALMMLRVLHLMRQGLRGLKPGTLGTD